MAVVCRVHEESDGLIVLVVVEMVVVQVRGDGRAAAEETVLFPSIKEEATHVVAVGVVHEKGCVVVDQIKLMLKVIFLVVTAV